MKTNKEIQDKVQSTIDVFDSVQNVKASPFFKDRVLQGLFHQKEEHIKPWLWFTPKLQFAVLVVILILNVLAFSQLNSNAYDDNLVEFAENFGLSDEESETFFLN